MVVKNMNKLTPELIRIKSNGSAELQVPRLSLRERWLLVCVLIAWSFPVALYCYWLHFAWQLGHLPRGIGAPDTTEFTDSPGVPLISKFLAGTSMLAWIPLNLMAVVVVIAPWQEGAASPRSRRLSTLYCLSLLGSILLLVCDPWQVFDWFVD
jgi:hypothetical protein